MVPNLTRATSIIAERYFHGILVGFGIMTAHGIWAGAKTVKIALAQLDWQRIREQVDAEQMWFWRKR